MTEPGADVLARLRPRALHRAESGVTLDRDEATALLTCRGDDLDRLLATASRVRDAGRRGARVTYSRKVFIPLTHLCRDTCGYCTFAWPPRGDVPAYLSPDEVVAIAMRGREAGCKEALFTLGDRPEERYPAARAWLESRGYETTLEYLRAVAILVIEATGLLPHLNPGVMSWTELATLKQVSASMGLMLESTSTRLLEKGEAHAGAPDKDPAVRLRTIDDAGRHAIPFTSGLLIGIGETLGERIDAVIALRESHRQFGHIQEVIVQNFRAKPDTAFAQRIEPSFDDLLATIAVTRLLVGPKVHVQAPPNLSPDRYGAILRAGIDDWGGVSPVTPDHVNPERPWPTIDELTRVSAAEGFELTERLTLYPEYARLPDPWLAGRMRGPVAALATADGFARPGHRPEPHVWQDPDSQPERGPSDAALGLLDDDGATVAHLKRGDLEAERAVYGEVAHLTRRPGDRVAPRRRSRIRPQVAAALRKSQRGAVLDDDEALLLFDTGGVELDALCRVADEVRAVRSGEIVTYVVNRNINFSNICYVGCRFCAFAQRRNDPDAFELTLDQVADRAEQAWQAGATEVCMQGGIHPDLGGDYYFAVLDAVKARVPDIHVHAFSPMEVVNGATRMGISIREWLEEAKRRGLGSIPGTAAEILDDDIRWILTKGKLPAATWVEVVSTAHAVGLPSTCTMMYGHVDEPRHWVAHLALLRSVQDRSGGFTEFVPLPFVHELSPIYLAGLARPGPTFDENRQVHAVARLQLQGAIDSIQVSWVKLGLDGAQVMLRGGVNDLGGTLMEESISRMAGAEHGIRQTPEALRACADAVGRPAAERSTTYEVIAPEGIRYRVAV